MALIRRRVVLSADAFVDIVVWRVAVPVAPSTHLFKYRISYVVVNECVIRYDNERGKGDHRHVGTVEHAYRFTAPDRLIADFMTDVEKWNHENGRT